MKNIILFNRVCSDGLGDFKHFTDLLSALVNIAQIQNFNIIPVVCVDIDELKSYVKDELQKLHFQKIYCSNINELTNYETNEALKPLITDLSNAALTIVVSIHLFPRIVSLVKKHTPPNTKLLFIGEHERTKATEIIDHFGPRLVIRSMGLGKDAYGIKLTEQKPLNSEEAFQTLFEQNPEFVESLLSHANAKDLMAFNEDNILMSSYFTIPNHFIRFLLFVAANKHLPAQKNIAIHFSSGKIAYDVIHQAFRNVFERNAGTVDKKYFLETNISKIILITPGKEDITFQLNDHGSKSIAVYNGFKLTDSAFHAMNACILLKAVSGDNTLEQAISYPILFYYLSTNMMEKLKTLQALSDIISQISEERFGSKKIKEDFLTLFNPDKFVNFANVHRNENQFLEDLKKLSDLDLEKMHQVFPMIGQIIKEQYNFYDQFNNIIIETLKNSLEAQADLTSLQTLSLFSSTVHDSSIPTAEAKTKSKGFSPD